MQGSWYALVRNLGFRNACRRRKSLRIRYNCDW